MPRLVIRKGEGIGRDQALGSECVVGRHPSADFVLDDHLVSRRHFRVAGEGGVWVLEDLGSTNGTRVNGNPIQRHVLADGDVVAVGTTELEFVQKDMLAGAGGARRAASGEGEGPIRRRKKQARAPVRRRRRR